MRALVLHLRDKEVLFSDIYFCLKLNATFNQDLFQCLDSTYSYYLFALKFEGGGGCMTLKLHHVFITLLVNTQFVLTSIMQECIHEDTKAQSVFFLWISTLK